MIPANMISDLRKLDRGDKLRIMEFLVVELSKEEGALLKAGTEYPIWTPFNQHEASQAMLDLLKSHQQNTHAK